ncbi:MAG: serine hydrolase domain-containing protein, partial [Omnitrophica WOR_2 bacterium]
MNLPDENNTKKEMAEDPIENEPILEFSEAEIENMIDTQAEPGPAIAGECVDSATNVDFERLCDEIVKAMHRLKVPGVAIGVLNGDEEQTAGLGITNVDNPLPVTAGTLFQIGSITKTVTCTAIMKLVEEGKLSLDLPVRTYLPDLRLRDANAARQVTLRHLLTHTAGWEGDYFDDSGPGDDALASMVSRLDRLHQITSPGTFFSYNNAGFYLVGRLIEIATGKPYEAVIKEMVLVPLGMKMSFFFPGDMMTYRVVSGHEAIYHNDVNEPKVARPWGLARAGNAVGGLVSTVNDLLRYARFHMGEGTDS